MTALAHRDAATHNAVPQVWILTKGEFGEGGHILGVYAEMHDAEPDVRDAFGDLPFDLDNAEQDPVTGAIRIEAGCDWLDLTPHPVKRRSCPQITT